MDVWGGECLGWWTSNFTKGVVNVWGGERLILHWGWWTSGVVNVWVVNVLQSGNWWHRNLIRFHFWTRLTRLFDCWLHFFVCAFLIQALSWVVLWMILRWLVWCRTSTGHTQVGVNVNLSCWYAENVGCWKERLLETKSVNYFPQEQTRFSGNRSRYFDTGLVQVRFWKRSFRSIITFAK